MPARKFNTGLTLAHGLVTAGTYDTIAAGDLPDLSGTYQPLDGDLTSLAAASGTNTLYYRSAASTWSPVTVGSGVSFSGGTLSATGSGGTVTSVGLSLPGIFTISGSPVTGSGTLTATLATQTANLVWAGPTGGAAAAPTFRALVAADLPAGTGTVTSVNVSGGSTGLTFSGGAVTSSGTITMAGTLAVASGGTGATDAATARINLGLSWKDPVKCASVSNLGLSGTSPVDGNGISAGDRILVRAQTDPKENGIYVVASGAWSRAADADTGAKLHRAAVYATQGSSLRPSVWTLSNFALPTIGTDSLTWVQQGTVTTVSVTTASGVSGSVATDTTTPAITLTLGAITPTSVAATGAVSGSNLSGTNTGDVTLSGSPTYLSIAGQVLTLSAIDLGSANASGTLAAGRFPALSGDATTSAGSLSVTVSSATLTDAGTNSAADAFKVRHNTSGTPAAGFGSVTRWQLQSSTTTNRDAADLTTTWVTATDASRKARTVLSVYDTAAREVLRGEASGTAALVGFLGATAAARQTGDAGTALVTFGLMSGTPTFAAANLTGTLAAAQFPALTGDVTTSAGSLAATLASSGVTAGTYHRVTVDAKGRVTASASAVTCQANHNANQSLTTGTWTTLSLNSEDWDSDGFHDTSTNNSRLTVPTGAGGKYLLAASVQFASNSAGLRGVRFLKGGTTVVGGLDLRNATSSTANFIVSAVVNLSAGDYVELQAFQSSGGNLNVETVSGYSPTFSITKLGE
jgi:hypothetical protein